ncbi:MAG: beta-ketoacyl-[acyl-carrier-protein] synthase II [Spirochaetales bacterium]|nr:MAG: beta-ketoacyl-[acyl-carrier-protein] synthase II [Spirochaetales bacterium]
MEKRRVAVTGLGVVSPVGNDVPSFWESIKAGRSGIGPITHLDVSELTVTIAGEVKDFDPSLRMDGKEARKMDRFSQFAIYAAMEAMEDAGLKRADLDPFQTGVCLGTGQGGAISIEEAFVRMCERGPGRIPPMTVVKSLANFGAANIALNVGARGPCQCIVTACAAGTDAIGTGLRWIRDGHADVVFAGGSEACITKLGIGAFSMIQALSTRNDEPEKASRPFDRDRDGFVMAEGAGVLVLEDWDRAVARGARIYCELAGFGTTCDAHHLTAPDPDGLGVARAMTLAIADAGLKPTDIDYVNAHGTSTPMNDPIETKAIKHAFGDHARVLKISSIKSMVGHCIGGAGGIESVASVLAIRDQYFPPTINLDNPDPECDLDYVPNRGVAGTIRAVVKNSMGFGGQNAVIVFKKA